jgi:hypothetical protein
MNGTGVYNKETNLWETEFDNRIEFRNDKGELHNDDGPAIVYFNGGVEYWENGQSIDVIKIIVEDKIY